MRARAEKIIAALIVALGAVLRFLGLEFGLPYFHHWDEANITDSVRDMVTHGDDVPRHFFYGEPMMRLTEGVYLAAQKLHIRGFEASALDDDVFTRVAGRFVSASIASTGTLAVYGAARLALRNPRAALASALLYATSCDLVIHARYCVTDAALAAITAWVIFLCARFVKSPTITNALLACIASGLAGAYKLTGLATLVLVIPAISMIPVTGWFRLGRRHLRVAQTLLAAAAIPIAAAIFLKLNPHVVDHWRDALGDYERVANSNLAGAARPFVYRERGLDHALSAIGYLFGQSYSPNVALALALFGLPAAIGIVRGLRARSATVFVGVLHAIAVVATVSNYRSYFVRYFMSVLPFLCIAAGLGADYACSLLARWINRRALEATWVAAAVVPATYWSVMAHVRVRDPRIAALDDVAAVAAREGGPVTLALSATVAVHEESATCAMASYRDMHKYIAREGVTVVGDVRSVQDIIELAPRFVINASYRDWSKVDPFTYPWEDQWLFSDVPGYRLVGTYPMNTYVQRLDIQADWNGRLVAVLLERIR